MLHQVDEIICYRDLTDQPTKSVVIVLERTISKEKSVEFINRMIEDCNREFKNFCKREKNKLVDVSVEMKSVFLSKGIPHEEIIVQAKQKNADFIIMSKINNNGKKINNNTLGVLLGADIPTLCL
jgi:hypothetical protein